jgi:dienelactone hydrolase
VRKKKIIVVAIVLGILVFFLAPPLVRSFWSILVLSELMNFDSRGWLGGMTSPPRIQEVSYQGPLGIVKADLYLPQPQRKGSGILLNHGVIDTGKDDPRLKRFANILCRAGFVVLVPDLKGMRSFRIAPSDVDEIQTAFEYFLSRSEILPRSCGLFGFSYGAGPTIIAACRPAIQRKVRFVVSFGGYYDLQNALSFIATGNFEFGGQRYFRQPQEYGKWVFLANNLDLVESPEDRGTLRKILQIKLRDENAPIDRFWEQLGGEGRNILNLLSHTDPSQTELLIRKLPPSVQSSIEALSVSKVLKNLQANLILAHGEDDDLIPFTETLRLAQAAPDPGRVYCQILRSFFHVDPDQRPLGIKTFFTFYLPEGWKLFRLVYQLMGYR